MRKRKDALLRYIFICISSITHISLFAQETRNPDAGFAIFSITFESSWSQETHPHPSGNLPLLSHWSDLIGVTHTNQITFLAMGAPASTGVQNVAELGSNTVFFQEVQQAISENSAYNQLDFGDLDAPFGIIKGEFEANPAFPFLTVLSMLAPSPDWIMAANSIELQDENGFWKQEISMNIFPYDTGTDSGIDYASDDEITTPPGVITNLQSTSPFSSQKIGTLTIVLDTVLGIEEQEITSNLSIFPNPSKGVITINTKNGIDHNITIYNVLGQSVYETRTTSNSQTIDLTHLHTGIYFLQSENLEGNQLTQKFIIK